MAGKPLRVVCVGRLKTAFWKDAAIHYLDRIKRMRPVVISEIRDADSRLDPPDRVTEEGSRILATLENTDYPIALDERGKFLSSAQFSALLCDIDQKALGRPCFIVGGPYGISQDAKTKARLILGLSQMTWPHELARVLLLEQIYRAECIRRKIPYHH